MSNEQQQQELLREAAAIAGIDLGGRSVTLPVSRDVIARPRVRLHYLDWGAPSANAPAIVFLHGGGLNAHTWDLVCLQLRDRYHCIAVDLRGYGDSEWSPEQDYSLDAMASDIEGLVAALGLPKFVLAGMSLGGLTSLTFAGRRAAALRALVIIDVGPDIQLQGAERVRQFINEGENLGTLDELVARAQQFNPRRSPDLLRRSLLFNLRERPDGSWMWKYDRRRPPGHQADGDSDGKEAQPLERARADFQKLWDAVPRISCPTLVVRGGDSDVFSEENAAKLVAALPDAEYRVVPNAGHSVQGDNPLGLATDLRDFLSRKLATPAAR